MNNYTLGVYEKAMPKELSWYQKMKIAKDIGYDFFEMSIDETDEKLARLEMSKQQKKELLDIMIELDFSIRTMCLSGHRKYPMGSRNEQVRKYSMDIIMKAIDLADALGIRIIQLAGYDVYYEEGGGDTVEFFMKNLELAVQVAAAKGIILAFETMETEFMDTVEKSMKVVRQINSPYLKIYPDIGNLKNASIIYGNNVYEDIEKGMGNIVAAHLKETNPGQYREIPYGKGHVDFQKSIEILWHQGVRRYVTELWYVQNDLWETELTRTHDIARNIFKGVSKC